MTKFFTLPNILTLLRMVLLPFFALGFFLDSETGRTMSLCVFLFCCITDYLDGYFARAHKQITKLGQMLDPLADKIVISITILFVVGFGLVSKYAIVPASIILCREIIISGVRDATELSGKDFGTSFISKCKTATQMLAISTILFASIIKSDIIEKSGEATLWISSIIAIISGLLYCKRYIADA